jgi:hypothetical protein
MVKINDFPKLESPFQRENKNGEYVVTPNINPGYEWVFNDVENVKAVEKLHGCFNYRTKEALIQFLIVLNEKKFPLIMTESGRISICPVLSMNTFKSF